MYLQCVCVCRCPHTHRYLQSVCVCRKLSCWYFAARCIIILTGTKMLVLQSVFVWIRRIQIRTVAHSQSSGGRDPVEFSVKACVSAENDKERRGFRTLCAFHFKIVVCFFGRIPSTSALSHHLLHHLASFCACTVY